jgi:hypothetical protein
MSKSKRRRPGVHPAKVARRPERDAARSAGVAAGPDRITRWIAHDTLELSGPLDAELWASTLHGTFWSQRYGLSVAEFASGCELVVGGPLAEAMGRIGGPGARILERGAASRPDLEDADALNTFVAGWNARSEIS